MNNNTQIPRNLHSLYSALILICLALTFYLALLQPALTAKKNNYDRIDNLAFQLNKFNDINSKIKFAKEEIEQLKSANYNAQGFLKNDSPAIVAANIQKNLTKVIKLSGGNLVSTQVVKQKNKELFPEITIKTHMRANIKSLRNILYKLATNKPLFFTENIIIQKRNRNSKNKAANNNLLEIRFDVVGFIDNTTSS